MGDGEREQVLVWSEEEVIKLLQGKNIDLLKLPAGLSFLYQANDVGRTHPLIKKGAKQARNECMDTVILKSFDDQWKVMKDLRKKGKIVP